MRVLALLAAMQLLPVAPCWATVNNMNIISLDENEVETVRDVRTAKLAETIQMVTSLDERNFVSAEKDLNLPKDKPLKLQRVRINLNFSAKFELGPIFGVEALTRQVVIWSKKGE